MSVQVGIIMGSDSDFPLMKKAVDVLEEFGVGYEVKVSSAHRTPEDTLTYAETAVERGLKVIIAGAGAAAASAWGDRSEDDAACHRCADQRHGAEWPRCALRDRADAIWRAGCFCGHRWREKRWPLGGADSCNC